MKSLVRPQFLNLPWDAADLDPAAEFWLRVYDAGKSWRFSSRTPQHSLEIRLSGFPRHATESLREELERRIAASDNPDLTVSLADSDTLLIRSEPRTATPPPRGLGLPLLGGPEFDSLLVELRFRVTGGDRVAIASRRASVSLVLVGEVRRGDLLLKALWRSPWSAEEDAPFWSYQVEDQMEEEGQLMAGLARFRATGEVPVPLAEVLFGIFENSAKPTDIFGRLTRVSFDGPRLRGLLVRIVAYVGLLAVFGFLIWEAYSSGADERLVLCISGAVAVGVVAVWFAYNECRLLFSALALSASHADESAERPGYRVLGEDETPLGDDPAVRKYTRELEKASFTRMGDITRPDDGPVAWVHRVFVAPDGITHLTLLCTLAFRGEAGEEAPRLWPAIVRFHAETFYASGGRVESVTEAACGYVCQPVGTDCLFRVLPKLRDPIELYQSHREAAEVFGLERGLTPKRYSLFEDYLRQQEAMEAERRQRSRERPRSWRDGLRWYLQWPRREQRG